MLEIEDIYSLLPEGTFSNIEAFKNYVETAGIESIYPAIPEGTFSSEEAFVKLYKKKKEVTESISETGSSDSFEPLEGDELIAPEGVADIDEIDTRGESPLSSQDFQVQDERQQASQQVDNTQLQQAPVPVTPEEQQTAVDTREDFEQQRAIDMENYLAQQKIEQDLIAEKTQENQQLLLKSDGFKADLDIINEEFIAQAEEPVVEELTRRFTKYGLTFEETGMGDAMVVSNFDNSKTVRINLDPNLSSDEILESKKLKDFIVDNSLEVYEDNDSLEFDNQAEKARSIRRNHLINPDGSFSTVKFTSYEEDGKHKVIPTLFPKDNNFYGTIADDWMELEFDDAKQVAEERGEVFSFETAEEAELFAEGEWKDIHTTDALGKSLYSEIDKNYKFETARYDEYLRVRDEIDFIESQLGDFGIDTEDELTDQQKKKYGNLYVEGILRDDASQILKELKEKEDALYSEVNTEELIEMREKFDLALNKKYDMLAQEAAMANGETKVYQDALNEQSISLFGVELKDLTDIIPKDEQDALLLDEFKTQAALINAEKVHAARKYENALTFYDRKFDKSITEEYETGIAAVYGEIQKGLKDGNASEVILQLSTGMPFDMKSLDINNPEDVRKAAEMIASLKGGSQKGKQGRQMARWNRAVGFRESLDAFLRNPRELALSLAANSISMMLPYGVELVAGSAATGATLGSIIPGAGTVAGGIKGMRVGMAATNFAMEYTNEFFDAMQANGYDVLDPDDVVEAINNDKVWATAKERGMKRGIPIAVMDYISSGLVGRVFQTGSVATKGRRLVLAAGERGIVDPAMEGAGEAAAQLVADGTLDGKEISAEIIGGFGANSSTAAVNKMFNIRSKSNIELANRLTDINFIAFEKSSDTRISKWTNNMLKLGKINSEQAQRIQKNLGLSKDADNLVNFGMSKNKPKNKRVKARLMELLAAKEEYSADVNRREIFGQKIKDINAEIAYLVENKTLAPDGQRAKIESITSPGVEVSDVRAGVSEYIIDGKSYTKEAFLKEIGKRTAKQMSKFNGKVVNDEEVSKQLAEKIETKTDTDAVQITETESVDARQQEAIGEGVGTGVPTAETTELETTETQEVEVPTTKPQTIVAVAPFFDTTIESAEQAQTLRESEGYQQYKNNLTGIGQQLGLEVEVEEGIGGYKNDAGTEIVEISNRVVLKNATIEQAQEYAALTAALAPETQESSIAAEFVEEGSEKHNGNEYILNVSDTQGVMNALKKAGITDYSINEDTGEVSFINIFDFDDPTLQDKIGIFVQELEANNINYEKQNYRAVNSVYVDQGKRKEILGRAASQRSADRQTGSDVYSSLLQAIENDAKFEGITTEEYFPGFKELQASSTAAAQEVADLETTLGTPKKAPVKKAPVKKDVTLTKPTKKLKEAFENNSISIEDSDAMTLYALNKKNNKKRLTPFEKRLLDGITLERAEKISDLTILLEDTNRELLDARASLRNSRRDSKDSKVDFKLKEESTQEGFVDTKEIVEAMSKVEEGAIIESQTEFKETSPTAPKVDVQELNSRTDNPLPVVDYEVIDGIPTMFSISDQLTTGNTINPYTGNVITNLKGGFGFNGIKGHEKLAWASIDNNTVKGQISTALRIYNNNKKLYKNWWAANPQYNGLVPMSIVKMESNSILSNEAVVRVMADNLSSFPKDKRVEALEVFRERLETKKLRLEEAVKTGIGLKGKPVSKNTIKVYRDQVEAIKDVQKMDKKIKAKTIDALLTPNALLQLKAITSVNVITGNIGYGTTNSPNKAAVKPGTYGKNPVAKALLGDNASLEERSKLHLGAITDVITEPQLKKTPARSVFLITGIDVLNPGIEKTVHPNYPVGPRGKVIGVIEQPKSMLELFPSAYNNAVLGKAQEDAGKNRKRSDKLRLSETIPVGMGLVNKEFQGTIVGVNEEARLLDFMNRSFPFVNISTDQSTMNQLIESPDVTTYLKGDSVVYGMTKDGNIFINKEVHDSKSELYNTAIHEMGHIWTKHLSLTPKGKKIYKRGAELVQQTELYKRLLKRFDGDVNKATEEAMATLIGNRGESVVNASLQQKIKDWITAVWDYVRTEFKLSKDLSAEEIQNLTMDEFLGTALADIFSGKPVKLSDAQLKTFSSELKEAMFKSDESMTSIIDKGRANGFSDASIKQVLKGRGFKVADIRDAMEVKVDVFTQLPGAFGNVEGGINEGMQLFREVKQKLSKFITPDKTMSEVRQKAMDLMKDNPIYKAQPEQTQMELLTDFDKTLNTRANVKVQKEIAAIKNNLRQRKVGAKNIKSAQIQLKNYIRKALPKSKTYTQAQINKLIARVNKSTVDTFEADTEYIMKIVDQQKTKMKKALVKDMLKLVKAKAMTAFTKSGKRRAKGLSKEGTSYFKAVKQILTADVDQLNNIQEKLQEESLEISLIIDKQKREMQRKRRGIKGETLTQKEQALLNLALAFDTFGDVSNMSLEEVQDLMQQLKDVRADSIATFKSRRLARVEANKRMKEQADAQIKETNPMLFDEDGNVLNKNERNANKNEILSHFRKFEIGKGLSTLSERMKFSKAKGLLQNMKQMFQHLGTLSNLLDRVTQGKDFFTKNVYDSLNRMDDINNGGLFQTQKKLDDIANTIPGITKGVKQVYSKLNSGVHVLKLKRSDTGRQYTDRFNADELMRIYALSLNDTQRQKLEAQGITPDVIENIKNIIGPEAVEFTDKTVNFLSNEYYESVNDVYSYVNDVNLGYVNNYFPTSTIQKKTTKKMLTEGDFSGVFNAESAPAFKERVDMRSDVDLHAGTFTTVLKNHVDTMEKYKAYAVGTQRLNALFQTDSVNVLLEEMGVTNPIKKAVNFAINPDSGKDASLSIKLIDRLQTNFTGFALGFKAIQILKQATSFVNAYSDYSYFSKDSKVPRAVQAAVDLPMFMFDGARVVLSLAKDLVGKKGAVRQAMEISPTFRKRVEQGLEGDVYGLESGSKTFKKTALTGGKRKKARAAFKTAAASPTIIGDVLGVMGYMINYKRNIANGMSKADAVKAFNDYNTTQQSRRGTDKIPLQMNSNVFNRAFTMFGSTLFLQMNKVMQSTTNIARDISDKKRPRSKDTRDLALNLAVANVLFVGVSNIAKFIKGDDEDKEAAKKKMLEAMIGLNLIYQLPFLGSAVEGFDVAGRAISAVKTLRDEGISSDTLKSIAKGENYKQKGRIFNDDIVNPVASIMQKYRKITKNDENKLVAALRTLAEITIGAQADPFMGLYNYFAGEEEDVDEAMYDVLGISPSYRPKNEGGKKSKVDKRRLKKMLPELYGPGGSLEPIKQIERDQRKMKRDIQKEIDAAMGLD